MIICHGVDFLPQYHRVWGGAELAASSIIDLLQVGGNRQSVIATKPLRPVKENFDFFAVPVLEDYFGKFGSIIKLWTFDPLSYGAASKVLKKIKPDVLHLHNFRTLSFSLVMAAKKLNIPILFSIYDNWCLCPNHTLITKANEVCRKYHGLHCFFCTYLHKKPSAFFRKPFFNHFLNKIDTFIVLSNAMAKVLADYGIAKERIEYIPLPLSQAIWQNETPVSVPVEPNTLLFAGWVSPHKGFKVLAEAMLKVSKKIPGVKLYVIETGVDAAYKNSILNFIDKNGLQNQIHFLGKRSNLEVQKFLKRCELVVVPEQWAIAWPIFLTEAMFAQKPIIASHIGDIPFFIKNSINGFTVQYDDPDAFAEKIIFCFEHRDLIKDFGRRSKDEIMKICDNNRIKERLTLIYKRLIP